MLAAKERDLCGDACSGCRAIGTCGAKPVPTNAGPANLPLTPGQETRGGRFFGEALAALLPLPAGFAAGFCFVPLLFPGAGDPARAAGGVLGLFAAAAGYYLFRRRYPPRNLSTSKCDTKKVH
jgi:hypothetical protein